MTPQVNMRASWLTSSVPSHGSPTNHGACTGGNGAVIRYSRIESHTNTKQRKCRSSWIDSIETSPAFSVTSIVPEHMNHPNPPPKMEKMEAFGVGYFGEHQCGRRPSSNNRPSQKFQGMLSQQLFPFFAAPQLVEPVGACRV